MPVLARPSSPPPNPLRHPVAFARKNRSLHAATRHPGRLFIDLYEGDPGYNATLYHRSRAPFLVHKASEGVHHVDSLHAHRCENTHGVGLAVGHYHYLDAGVDPAAQANHFWETIRGHFLNRWPLGRGHDSMRLSHTDFCIVDVEVGGASEQSALHRFESEFYRVSHDRDLIGYSGKSFLLEHGLHLERKDKWWVADYPYYPGNIGRRILWAHQFTSEFRGFPGVSVPCDASVLTNPQSIRYWDAQNFA